MTRRSKHSFVVLAYASAGRAQEALDLVEALGDEKLLTLKDAAIARKDGDGRIAVDQTRELSVGQGAIVGGVAGFLLGLATGGVATVTLVGLASGGGLGFLDTGIGNRRMKEIGESLQPGHAALGVLVSDLRLEEVRERLAPLGGELVVAELTPEAEEALAAGAGQAGEGNEPGAQP